MTFAIGSSTNATSYTLLVFNASGTALNNLSVTGVTGSSVTAVGLTAGSTYKFQLMAMGDGTHYSNSDASTLTAGNATQKYQLGKPVLTTAPGASAPPPATAAPVSTPAPGSGEVAIIDHPEVESVIQRVSGFEAELAEMDLATKRGELIQVKAVELVWSSALASCREHLLQVRARLAPMLAVETETFRIEQLLDLEHNRALNFLAGVELPKPGGG
mgnify:CR=1 FL=1